MRHFLTSIKLEKLTTKLLKQNFQWTLTHWVVGKNHKKIRKFRTPFTPRYIRRNPRSLYATAPIIEMARAFPSPIVASPHAALATIVPPCTCLTTDTLMSWILLWSGRLKCSVARVLIVTLCRTKVLTFASKMVDFRLLSISSFLITIRSMTWGSRLLGTRLNDRRTALEDAAQFLLCFLVSLPQTQRI